MQINSEEKNISAIDIINLNRKIFGENKDNEKANQKYRSYNKSDILKILSYQRENNLNNIQLANHFRVSRNTVAKWKKLFLSLKMKISDSKNTM